ncbi:MAG: cyanoexosortase A [Cyanobacteria bacterium]|nr:cyanoexosortase A [Cyanobacteriota bacterium]
MVTQQLHLPDKPFRYGMLALLVALLSIYMGLMWRYGDTAHMGMSGLFILATGMLLWERRDLKLTPTGAGMVLGAIGVVLFLGISTWLFPQAATHGEVGNQGGKIFTVFLRLLPALAGLSVALLASGWAGMRQFWRELGILLALGLPGVVAAFIADISPLTARFSGWLLQAGGYDVVREGLVLRLPGGGVEVYYGCSGMESISYLIGLSALCLIVYPVSGLKRYITPVMGIILGFVINAIRVALMAVLWSSGNEIGFTYWHEGEGSLMFGLIAVIAFGCFYMVIQLLDQRQVASGTK